MSPIIRPDVEQLGTLDTVYDAAYCWYQEPERDLKKTNEMY